MKRACTTAAFLCLLLLAPVAAAQTLELNALDFPERQTIDLSLTPQPGAPEAKMNAKVTFRDGQAKIELSYQAMKPAILYGEDVTCYVLWAVTRDGNVSNLGELLASTPKGTFEFSTRNKAFALLVTTEPYYLVRRPSALPVFTSDPYETKKMSSTAFQFSSFRPVTPARAVDSIRELAWDSKTPLELLQARKAHEIAGKLDAAVHSGQFYVEAGESLEMAEAQLKKSPKSKQLIDYSRRSVALSNEAINISVHRIEGLLIEAEIAKRRAEVEALLVRAQAAQAEAREAEVLAAGLVVETTRLQGQKAQLRTQNVVIADSLEGALSHVAKTENTARGFVISLPDILFSFNEATLKPEAEVVLAKLAGILLVMQNFEAAVEGFTDSTGSEEYNLKLSLQRAESVMNFLDGQGVGEDRLQAIGLGMERPVAENDTEEGRKQNRRVEIIISE